MKSLRTATLACVVAVAAGMFYLYDPPWIGRVTSGFGRWQTDREGARFRWTLGRASFFIPSDVTEMTLPVRAPFPETVRAPVTVRVAVDGRPLTDVVLSDPNAWLRPRLPLPRRATWRSYRRVDLRIDRTVGPIARGVQLGEVELRRP